MSSFCHPFKGRTIHLVRDLSLDEQKYLYNKTSQYKKAFYNNDKDAIKKILINDGDLSLYLLFQENSTRTKESFLNAAKYHALRVNDFKIESSSFEKKESITDTVRMLVGYSKSTGFIVRTSFEGTCRWLEIAFSQYVNKMGIMSRPFFINAGDGRHEHPTQEFLDEFSFLEVLNGSYDHIHIALIGDLYHSRTVHSKKDGLRVFKEVEVDLIAPSEIEMPAYYKTEMEKQGFEVRSFSSIEEYLSQKNIASLWYFTRLQLERMSEDVLKNISRIRSSIIFKKKYLSKISDEAAFFHPLPRNKMDPTIPKFLDNTPHNAWDMQSINGYHIRVLLLSMLSGKVGEDFEGESIVEKTKKTDFLYEIDLSQFSHTVRTDNKITIKLVSNGTVIDHIGVGHSVESIWNRIDVIRRILGFNMVSTHGVFQSTKKGCYKGIISIPNIVIEDKSQLKKIGAISSGCTINVIRSSSVVKKMRVRHPRRIYNFSETYCRNEKCISHPSHYEPAYADFYSYKNNLYICNYCETQHTVNEIWRF